MTLTDDVVEFCAKAIEAATGYSGDIARQQARAALEAARYGEMREGLRKLVVACEALGRIDDDGEHWLTTPELEVKQQARALLSTIGEPNPDSGGV